MGWIKCSEQLPDIGKDVQVYCDDSREQFVAFRCIGGSYQFAQYEDVSIACDPSHWMTLPDPPTT